MTVNTTASGSGGGVEIMGAVVAVENVSVNLAFSRI